MKKRLDQLLVERELAPTIKKAQAMIMAGEVRVDNQVMSKAGTMLEPEADIAVKVKPRYVSRGGLKLEGALADFEIDVTGYTCADVGASTGGFTDCLLQHGAEKIFAIDVGYGILAHKIRSDERVLVLERTNARYLESLPEKVDIVVIDASFISLTVLLPAVKKWIKPQSDIIALIKPQYEAERKNVADGGIVTGREIHERVIRRIVDSANEEGLTVTGLTTSPIIGAKSGNIEFFIRLQSKKESFHFNIDQAILELF